LLLDIDYFARRFEGEVGIALDGASGDVDLDSVELEIRSAVADGVPVPFRVDPSRERLALSEVPRGTREVRITFSGTIPKTILTGFYESVFDGGHLLTTMLYPTGCRRLFPCFDVPAQKAVIRLTVRTDPALTVISNTSPVSRNLEDGGRTWEFEPTPRMSTYLFYLGVGPFETIEQKAHGVNVIVAMPPGKVESGRSALTHASAILNGFAEYYGLPYPLSKLHLVAVPAFWAGAMENWGAITFAEAAVAVDSTTTTRLRRNNLVTLAHEIAHQWFGKLVTMAWWNDFWLNESFATFASVKMVDRLGWDPEAWSDLLLRWTRGALHGDSLRATHPVDVEIRAPEEIVQIADEISYGKGASILRMIDAYLGEERFRQGLTLYLERFQFRNATGPDLWQALEEASKEPVTRIMGAWTRLPGYPVVKIRQEPRKLVLEQARFLYAGGGDPNIVWPIPLTLEIDGRTERIFFQNAHSEYPTEPHQSLRVNPGRTGFFRVQYEKPLRTKMLEELAEAPELDRWALVNDAAAFFLAGAESLDDFAEVVRVGESFTDYLTVRELIEDPQFFLRVLSDVPRFLHLHGEFFRTHLARLGLTPSEGEPATVSVLRERLAIGRVRGDPTFAAELATQGANLEGAEPNLRPAITLALAHAGGELEFERLLTRFRTTSNDAILMETANALGAFDAPDLIHRALDLSLEPSTRIQFGFAIDHAAGVNPEGRKIVWDWLKQNFSELDRRSTGTPLLMFLLEDILPVLGLEQEGEVGSFFSAHSFPGAARGVRKGIELLGVVSSLRRRLREGS
jgi:tricorn protease interacting factor F2/3